MGASLMRIHTLLAGFFLPVAVVFAVTGGLYTFGIKGDYDSTSKTLSLPISGKPSLEDAVSMARQLIETEFSAEVPSGSAGVKSVGTSWQFEWTGSRADFTLDPLSEPGQFKATYKKTTPHRYFVQLHKAKGGDPFKWMAGGLAVAFLFLFVSGAMISFTRPQLKPLFLKSLAAGLAAFLVLAGLS